MRNKAYPIVDLFAGPGGLGEGFVSGNDLAFKSLVSIEMEKFSHQTLLLRHFFRSYSKNDVPEDYYDYLASRITKEELITKNKKNWNRAMQSALQIELCPENHSSVKQKIESRLKGTRKWALLGGPPCQAYSLVGRSRMSGMPEFENDRRHFLYREYIQIIKDHRPPVFVMENVKGLLSARIKEKSVVETIISELSSPIQGKRKNKPGSSYKLYSLSHKGEIEEAIENPEAFLIRSEEYGVPQARHRLFILGIRCDIDHTPGTLNKTECPSVEEVIGDMQQIRSGVSKQKDSLELWKSILASTENMYETTSDDSIKPEVSKVIKVNLKKIKRSKLKKSSVTQNSPKVMRRWYVDNRLQLMSSHESRSHMESDLHRYLYAAAYGEALGVSPKLPDFPRALLPAHKNARTVEGGKMFSDRFRVQVKSRPSTTITSHISKDGHYFIHYDPEQCRSLSVREAARLQTFPDNYHFEGPRTAQYHQVGNAVPPFLAHQIAKIVKNILDQMPGK